MSEERQHRLAQFVAWSTQHITGDEKGQAQIFLDRLFQAFGQRGSLDVGGTPEFRVRSTRDETGGGGGGGGTSFADYVWKPVVLIEMKKRGELLAKHRQQAFDYWIKLVPNRPQYTVLCNFDEFWIYDFNIDLDDPLDTVNVHVSIANWVKLKVVPTPSSAVPSLAPPQRDVSAAPNSPTPPSPGIAIPGSTLPTANAHASSSEIPNPKSDPLTPASPLSTPSVSAGPNPALAQKKLLIPEKKKLWFKSDPKLPTPKISRTQSVSTPGKSGKTLASKSYELDFRDTPVINSALSDETDVAQARVLKCNQDPPRVYNGQFPRHQGFVIEPSEAEELIRKDSANREVVHPFLIGQVMITDGKPDRWVIDFQKMDIFSAKRFAGPFRVIEKTVLPHVQSYADKEKEGTGKESGQDQTWLRSWWQHFRCRKELIDNIRPRQRYLACCEVTKRPIFCFVDPFIRPDHTLEAFVLEDDYSFGILQSAAHWLWFTTKCSKLTERFRYTPESVFDTFPWPQSPTKAQINAVAAAGREIRRIRTAALQKIPGGLRALYRTLELPGRNPLKDAHASLDSATLAAYGFTPTTDLLSQLLALNLEVAANIESNTAVTPPGIPQTYGDFKTLVTDDCIEP